jgi:TfoX/Sxy family transcriptional regulator of competence genes
MDTSSLEGVTLETKHFFSGAALYADGKISAILGPVGLAVKLPSQSRQSLINEDKGREFQFFEKGPIKREYILLAEAIVEDRQALNKRIEMSIRYAISEPISPG